MTVIHAFTLLVQQLERHSTMSCDYPEGLYLRGTDFSLGHNLEFHLILRMLLHYFAKDAALFIETDR